MADDNQDENNDLPEVEEIEIRDDVVNGNENRLDNVAVNNNENRWVNSDVNVSFGQ